ncbi:lipocalin family protein [Hyphomicrobium sp.]|uniref:lipocalin family protein n=1 Tax=Hyphomicrobium sp. TaxID=82 RepID=UPI002C49E6D4|nr:lipocalin family protein [Hyphomicrobium sp.]HRN87858.1 lipocalin family protein [Hyphomicrobium sp.]HRQ27796.1 lipocalin family protein [Hyphomicrobium sp.]
MLVPLLRKCLPISVAVCSAVSMPVLFVNGALADEAIPNLVGTWVGENRTISDKKGFSDWGTKTVEITEQRDRRFKGHFTYADGTKHFFGIIYPDNETFTWVASDSKGYNHGRVLGPDRISACYIESGEEATAGCADMKRKASGE